jgi:hypothetical protein
MIEMIIAMMCSSVNLERFIIRFQFVGTNSTQKWRRFRVSGHRLSSKKNAKLELHLGCMTHY